MDDIINGLDNFECVWQRVTGETPKMTDEAAILGKIIRKEAEMASLYRAGAINRLLQEKQNQLRMLQGEYFLLTGEKLVFPVARPAACSMPELLRKLYTMEREMAECINANASAFSSRDTQRNLIAAAQQDEEHARKIKELTIKFM